MTATTNGNDRAPGKVVEDVAVALGLTFSQELGAIIEDLQTVVRAATYATCATCAHLSRDGYCTLIRANGRPTVPATVTGDGRLRILGPGEFTCSLWTAP